MGPPTCGAGDPERGLVVLLLLLLWLRPFRRAPAPAAHLRIVLLLAGLSNSAFRLREGRRCLQLHPLVLLSLPILHAAPG